MLWKVMEFSKTIFPAWKVMKNNIGHRRVVGNDCNVVDFFITICRNYEP